MPIIIPSIYIFLILTDKQFNIHPDDFKTFFAQDKRWIKNNTTKINNYNC